MCEFQSVSQTQSLSYYVLWVRRGDVMEKGSFFLETPAGYIAIACVGVRGLRKSGRGSKGVNISGVKNKKKGVLQFFFSQMLMQ